MPKITEDLEYILYFLTSINPESADCYNPGLTRQQINQIIKDLPLKFCDNFYDLYQWRNGYNFNNEFNADTFLFCEQLYNGAPAAFCSLEDSVYVYNMMCSNSQADMNQSLGREYWNRKWFPIGAYEFKRILYVVGDLNPSPVYLWEVGCRENPVRVYKNLSSMISTIAECCESGLYQTIPDEYGEVEQMIIRIDDDKLDIEREIYQKHNS